MIPVPTHEVAQGQRSQLASVEVKPLLETALHLSRIAKLLNVRVQLVEEASSPSVLADSSQLLHVFLQIVSNAMEHLQESGGGRQAASSRQTPSELAA